MRVTAALVLHFEGEGDGNAAVEKDHGAVFLPLLGYDLFVFDFTSSQPRRRRLMLVSHGVVLLLVYIHFFLDLDGAP